jgi:hypothetical protein
MENQIEAPATPFIDALMSVAPADRAAAIKLAMEGMTPEELEAFEADAKAYFAKRHRQINAWQERRVKNLARADLSPYGAAAQRRRNQAAAKKEKARLQAHDSLMDYYHG